MENVLLVIHLILALSLIGVVLLQRSEGGGLGMGGGGGGGSVGGIMSGRAAATALGRLTWGLAVAFIATSVVLTILAAQSAQDSSVVDRLGAGGTSSQGETAPPEDTSGEGLLPPSPEDEAPASSGDGPVAPPRAD